VSPGAGTGPSSCNSQDGWCSFETGVQNSLWYSFEAPASGSVTIVATGFDTQLALWDAGDCDDFSTFTEIAANDDNGDDVIPGNHPFAPAIIEAACLNPGQTYYIQLDGFNGASGSGDLHLIDSGNEPLTVDAGECQSRFLGYESVESEINYLQATASGGFPGDSPPYTFAWDPAPLSQVDTGNTSIAAVQPDATTSYLVTVTDSKGCTETSGVDVVVFDVTCGKKGQKVEVCHVPPGNPANEHEICISPNAVPDHLAHGDRLGPCDNECLDTNPPPQ
jgi:hypothetical protein